MAIRTVEENYAKQEDEAQQEKTEESYAKELVQAHREGKIKEDYAKEVGEAWARKVEENYVSRVSSDAWSRSKLCVGLAVEK